MEEDKQNEFQEQVAEEQNSTETAIAETKKDKKSKKKKKERKGSYILGTIGAILGGLVAVIPWMLTYIFASNMVIPVFASLIPFGAFLGYKIFRGRIGKPFRVIIAIISLIIIVLLTTIVCPTVLLIQSGYEITWANIVGLYSDTREDVRKVIIEDLVAGLAFTILALIVVIKSFINKQINEKIAQELKLQRKEAKSQLKEKSEAMKQVCTTLNCMCSENAVAKKVILQELKNTYNLKTKKCKQCFLHCKLAQLLKKYKGKYYYDENDEENKIEKGIEAISKRKFRNKIIKLITLVIIVALAIYAGITIDEMLTSKDSLAGTNIKVQVDTNTQYYYGTDKEITEQFGEDAATQCDFVLVDKAGQYEANGKAVPKTAFEEGEDLASIIQEDREDFAQYLGEESMSEITDKQFGDLNIKSYNYTYTGVDGNQYRSVVYLCEANNHYVWLSLYTGAEVDMTEIDKIVDNFIK